VSDHLIQVAIRRDHQPCVHSDGTYAAQSFKFLLLENAQQLGLQLRWNIANFIQKEGSLVCEFDSSNLLCDGSGKRSLFVAEKFALQQSGGNGRAI
jgi:hypothetical protein